MHPITPAIMVRSVTFEIRWHDMQPIYSCSFQPVPPSHLRRVLDFNQSQGERLGGRSDGRDLKADSVCDVPLRRLSGWNGAKQGAGGRQWQRRRC